MNGKRDDAIGRLIKRDEAILAYGLRLYEVKSIRIGKEVEVKKSIRTDMRKLARLYQNFLYQGNPLERYNNAMDMFNKINFPILKKSIKDIGTDADIKVKGGLKLSIFYLLLSTGRIFEAKLRHENELEEADIVKMFLSDLKLFEYKVFGDARLSILTQQKKVSKKPSELPYEGDLKMIRKYCISKNLRNST